MIGFKVTVEDLSARVQKAAEQAAFKNFGHAAASIRKTAVESIEKAAGPSEPGRPPHTHRRMFLRRAIRYAADKEGAVIGPAFSTVGTAGEAHEFGGVYKGGVFPQRPFMGPALMENLPRFASEWRGSITE